MKKIRQGFVKVAAVTPDIRVADVEYNTKQICAALDEAAQERAKIVVFPELCVTGYTCGDLFAQDVLLQAAKTAIKKIAAYTEEKDMLAFVGTPLQVDGKLYNTAAAVNRGKIIGFTTKTFLPNYAEFYEMRQFAPGPEACRDILFDGESVFYGAADRSGRDLRGRMVSDPAQHRGCLGGRDGHRQLFGKRRDDRERCVPS